jgi:hypothetical protein
VYAPKSRNIDGIGCQKLEWIWAKHCTQCILAGLTTALGAYLHQIATLACFVHPTRRELEPMAVSISLLTLSFSNPPAPKGSVGGPTEDQHSDRGHTVDRGNEPETYA